MKYFTTFAPEMANSYFQFKQFRISQDRCAMKVGTDGTLLGAWAHGGKTILDIGTGTGVIALMMAQRFAEASVTAIDIDADACRQAEANVAASPFASRVRVRHIALQDFASSDASQQADDTPRYASVVCNPPFFNDSLQSPDRQRTIARHTTTLSYRQLFLSAARLEHADAQFRVGVFFYHGIVVNRDEREALKWFRKAAMQNHLAAMSELGIMYAEGKKTQHSPAKAYEWTRKAAEAGHPQAICNLASFYERGVGVEQNFTIAVRLYEKAADLKIPEACFALSHLCYKGIGTKEDHARSARLCRKAADLGHREATLGTGIVYHEGDGVEQDDEVALRYFKLALSMGMPEAKRFIDEIEKTQGIKL